MRIESKSFNNIPGSQLLSCPVIPGRIYLCNLVLYNSWQDSYVILSCNTRKVIYVILSCNSRRVIYVILSCNSCSFVPLSCLCKCVSLCQLVTDHKTVQQHVSISKVSISVLFSPLFLQGTIPIGRQEEPAEPAAEPAEEGAMEM